MSVSGKVSLRVDFLEALAQDLGAKQFNLTKSLLLSLDDGSGLNQVSKLYADDFSQIQSVNTDLDLNPGPTGAFAAVAFTTLKGIIVFAGSANPGNLIIGNVTNGIVAPFGAATHSQSVSPGGFYANLNPSATGWTVTAGTQDLVRIASAATAGTYTGSIILLGT
jgi:hypothetical protein